jgi:arylsulfatase A-like enzyme
MNSKLKDVKTFLFFWGTCIYLEILIPLADNRLFGDAKPLMFVYMALFSVPFALLIYLITSIPRKPVPRLILSIIFVIILVLFFGVELFSKGFFKNYMSLESVASGGKGMMTDFADETIAYVGSKFQFAILLLIPIPFLIFFYKLKFILHDKSGGYSRWITVGLTLLFFSTGLIVVQNMEEDRIVYEENYEFDTAVNTFGVTAAVRLDAEYLIFGHGSNSEFEFTAEEFDFNDTEDVFSEQDFSEAGDPAEGIVLPEEGEIEETVTGEEEISSETPEKTEKLSEVEDIPDASTVKPRRVYGKHDCGLDFEALAEAETNSKIASIDRYIASLTTADKNEYTGLFEGKNLIFITAEAFSEEVIDPEFTPALYRLATKGINFTNYYQPVWGGSTSTGEFSNLTGLVPAYGISSMKKTADKNMYYTIGNQLRREGYFSRAFHAHYYTYYGRDLTHENIGYDQFIARGNGLENDIKYQWPESDLELMQATVDMYIDQQPFSVYYMSVSGHTNYNWSGNAMSYKNKDAVKDMDVPTPIKAYLACNLEFEYAMEYLLERLEEEGILDDTVIVIGNDHYPFGLEQEGSSQYKNALGDLYGYDYKKPWERDHNRLIIWCGSLEDEEPIVVDDPVYSLDIIPTLSNLFGTDYDSRLYAGRDALSDELPLVLWANYSWMTDKACCSGGKVEVFEGYEDEVTDEYIKAVKSIVANKFTFSKNVLDYDYYNVLFGDET